MPVIDKGLGGELLLGFDLCFLADPAAIAQLFGHVAVRVVQVCLGNGLIGGIGGLGQ